MSRIAMVMIAMMLIGGAGCRGGQIDRDAGDDAGADAGSDGVPSSLAVYPALRDWSGNSLYQSPLYEVTAMVEGGNEEPSYVYTSENDNNPGLYGLFQYANHWTSFSMEGAVTVKVRVLDRASISSAVLRPGSRQVTDISGNTVTFTLSAPQNLYVEIDTDLDLDPLFVFASPPEQYIPSSSDPNVIVLTPQAHDPSAIWQGGKTVVTFAPGLHDLGTSAPLEVPAGRTVYLAGGAYVKGRLWLAEGTGTVITGHGILSGIDYPETTTWGTDLIDGRRYGAVMGVDIDGLTLVDAPGVHAIVDGSLGSAVVIDNLKCLAWHSRTDGLGGGPGTVVKNCFMKIYDDVLKLMRDNTAAFNNVVWLQGQGGAIQMGWNAYDSTTYNHVDGLYIIHDNLGDRGGDNDHLNNNIVSLREIHAAPDGTPPRRRNIVIENVVQEGGNLYQAFGVRINDLWFGAPYGIGNGSLEDIVFRDIVIEGLPRYRSVFNGVGGVPGRPEDTIRNVTFQNVRINGELLTSANAGTYLDIQAQCSGFSFTQ